MAAALVTWLRTLGEYVVARTVVTARRSLHEVITPPDAVVTRVEGNTPRPVRVPTLAVGDIIVVGTGQRLPVDGTVVRGEALVNQQTMTGEALPVERRAGDTVFAATTVEYGEVAVRIDRVGLDTAVGRIVRAIEGSAEEKSDIQAFAERLADRDVGRTLGLAASPSEKFAKLLLSWSTKSAQSDGSAQVKLTLTHEEVAEIIGTTRETVSRLFSEFKKKQLMQLKGATLVIRSRMALEKIVQS